MLALDVTWRHNSNTSITGYNLMDAGNGQQGIQLNTGFSTAFGFAPAVEYNWKPNLGVLLGTRIIPAGYNVAASVTPAVAINMVY